jgi:UDP-2,3-diacylglucosamine hydrolase
VNAQTQPELTRLGLIAGNGVMPLVIARAARERGIRVIAVAHQGETRPELAELVDEIGWIRVGQLETMINQFKRADIREAAMAGGISRANLPTAFAPDARALVMLSRIGRLSDDAVLRGVAEELEVEGIAVVDPVPLLPELLTPAGLLAGPKLTDGQLADLRLGFQVLDALGRFDIGQTVAVRNGVVSAIETVEGTDAALRRAASLGGQGLVVAKAAKHSQDLRFDRPAIGPDTIELLAEIGAAVIGVQAGVVMLLEREAILARADHHGIALYGHE